MTLNADGKLTVNIRGLVLNDPSVGKYDGSPDGVDVVAVTVVCRGKRGLVAAQTEPVALSQNGDVRIDTRVSVPEACADPYCSDSRALRRKDWWLACCNQQVSTRSWCSARAAPAAAVVTLSSPESSAPTAGISALPPLRRFPRSSPLRQPRRG